MIVYTVDYVAEDGDETEELHTKQWMADYRAFKVAQGGHNSPQPRWVQRNPGWGQDETWSGRAWNTKVYEMKVQTP